MSGGVDSAVACALLQEAGYEVVGCFMRLGSPDAPAVEEAEACEPSKPGKQGCCSVQDATDARLVAGRLGVPLYVLNFRAAFDRVIDYFVDEYNAGRTPNPCVRCNDWLKFGRLDDYARSIGADFVATGHHARVEHAGPRPRLLCGRDAAKDQSYVLFGASRDRLARMLLPVGELTKERIRRMARERDLPVFDKPDSQEICFVPGGDYARLVQLRTPAQVSEGAVLGPDGAEVGRHAGHQHFTIGQRRGLGVALGRPVYVVDKDPETNTVTVGDRQSLLAGGLEADQVNWIADRPQAPLRCRVRIRYNGRATPATVRATGEDRLTVWFDEPVASVTPGQAVVCYEGEEVLGGGWIRRALGAGGFSS